MAVPSRPVPGHLALVTLGVEDVPRARAFYEQLGLEASGFESDDVAFFEMNGTILGLFGARALAEDANVPYAPAGFRGVSCSFNVESEADVDAVLAHAKAVGARILKRAQEVFWGGYSGYFSDPDGHLWEVAYNPVFPLTPEGRVQLPPPKGKS